MFCGCGRFRFVVDLWYDAFAAIRGGQQIEMFFDDMSLIFMSFLMM